MIKRTMTHPDMPDVEIQVPASAVSVHMASGWEPVDGKVAKAEKANVPTDVDPAVSDAEKDEAAAKSTKRSTSKES